MQFGLKIFTTMPWFVAGVSGGGPPDVSRGDVVELSVRDNGGNSQGEILVGVLAFDGLREGGPVFRGTYLGASDPYYAWWMSEGDGATYKDEGYYHLCTVPSERCPPVRRYVGMVHSDRCRNHFTKSLTTRKIPWLSDKDARELVTANLAKFKSAVTARGAAASKAKGSKKPNLSWNVDDEEHEDDDEDESEEETGTSSDSVDDNMRGKLTKLREELKKAEKEMEERRAGRGKKAKSGRAMKGVKKTKTPRRGRKAKVTLPQVGVEDDPEGSKERKKKKKSKKRAELDRKRRERSGSDEGEEPSKVKHKKKKKGRSERRGEADVTRTSGDDDSDIRKAKAASLFSGKPKGEEESDERNRVRGPFGEGFGVSYGDDESDSSESDFRKGPSTPAKSGQLKLIRYSSKYPGRLASRMLVKMEQATARGVGGPFAKRSSLTPPVAMNHMLTVLIPSLGERAGMRTVRELKTLGVILDHLAVNQFAKAADVVSQRIKALERATHEKHWGAAQFLELLPPEGTMLLDRDEEMYLAREYLLDQRLKNYDQPKKWNPERPGKGGGKEKGQKGDKGGKDAKGGGKKNQWHEKGEKKGEEKGSA